MPHATTAAWWASGNVPIPGPPEGCTGCPGRARADADEKNITIGQIRHGAACKGQRRKTRQNGRAQLAKLPPCRRPGICGRHRFQGRVCRNALLAPTNGTHTMKRENLGRAQDDDGRAAPSALMCWKEKIPQRRVKPVPRICSGAARAPASVEKPADQENTKPCSWPICTLAPSAGRIMSAAVLDIQATLINCFVQPVGDCIQGVDDGGSRHLRSPARGRRNHAPWWRWAMTSRAFARAAPEVRARTPMASGPCSYINVFDQSCSTVEAPVRARRADGRAAHRPPGRATSSPPKPHTGPLEQLQTCPWA